MDSSNSPYETQSQAYHTSQLEVAGLLRELASNPSPAEATLHGHAPTDDATLLDADAEAEPEPNAPIKPPGKKRGRKPIPGNVERRKAQNRVSQRTYRDKKDQYVKDLESQTNLLEENYSNAFELIDTLYKENAELRQTIGQPTQTLHESLQSGLLAPLYRTYLEDKGQRPPQITAPQYHPEASSSRLPTSPPSDSFSGSDSQGLPHGHPSPTPISQPLTSAALFEQSSYPSSFPPSSIPPSQSHYSLPPLPSMPQNTQNTQMFNPQPQGYAPTFLPERYNYDDGRRLSWGQSAQPIPPLQRWPPGQEESPEERTQAHQPWDGTQRENQYGNNQYEGT